MAGVAFALLLFAITGAGILLPESYTRVGEVPEVGRPMMQRMIAVEPAQAQFQVLTAARRSEELDRLRERAALEVVPEFAAAQPEPTPPQADLLKPAAVENLPPGDMPVAVAAPPDLPPPDLQPSGAMGTAPAAASIQIRPAAADADETPDAPLPAADAGPVQVAALPPASADVEPAAPWPDALKVPLPLPRPSARTNDVHRRAVHRKPRVAQTPPETFGQNLFTPPPLLPRYEPVRIIHENK